MAQQTINIGSAPDAGDGDTARAAFDICNDNFTEMYGPLRPPVSGLYLPCDPYRGVVAGSATTANRAKFTILEVKQPLTVAALSIWVSTASTGNSSAAAMGAIYAVTGDSAKPLGALLGYTGTFATSPAARSEATFAAGSGSNVTLAPGIYAVGILYFDSTLIVSSYSGGMRSGYLLGGVPVSGIQQNATSNSFILRYDMGGFSFLSDLTAVAPQTFGGSSGSNEEPHIALKVA